MCGLWGMASTKTLIAKHDNFLKYLGTLSSSRGVHSTGVASFNVKSKGFEYAIQKEEKSPSQFFSDHKTSITSGINNIFLGHNRFATIGGISKETSHPFLLEKDNKFLVGTHNGTLTGYYKEKEEYLSDSHKFYSKAIEDGFKKTLNSLGDNSAYCFVYVEQIGNRPDIKMFRNDQRTLFLCLSKDKETIVWASEKRFIIAANTMSDIGLDVDNIYSLKTNTLLRINVAGKEVEIRITKNYLPEDKIKSHEKKYTTRSTSYRSGYSSVWNGINYIESNTTSDGVNASRNTSNRTVNDRVYQPSCNYILLPNGTINIIDKKSFCLHKSVLTSFLHYDQYLDLWKQAVLSDFKKPYLKVSDDYKVITMFYPPNSRGKVKSKEVVDSYLDDKYDGWYSILSNQEVLLSSLAQSTTMEDRKYFKEKIAASLSINEMRRKANTYKKEEVSNKVVPFSKK